MREVIEGQPASRSAAVRSRSHLPALTKGTLPASFSLDSSQSYPLHVLYLFTFPGCVGK